MPRILYVLSAMFLLFVAGCSAGATEVMTPLYNADAIDYFSQIAFGTEWGTGDQHVRKWTSDIHIRISGPATGEDLEVIHQVVSELNLLVQPIRIDLVEENPNVELRFVSREELDAYGTRAKTFFGIALATFNKQRKIFKGEIGILASEPPIVRAHTIREEMTQVLGLMVDTSTYPDSIFYQPYSETTEYAEIDRQVIEMLYRPEIKPGMTKEEALQVLRDLY